jgi:hypothetical protein
MLSYSISGVIGVRGDVSARPGLGVKNWGRYLSSIDARINTEE